MGVTSVKTARWVPVNWGNLKLTRKQILISDLYAKLVMDTCTDEERLLIAFILKKVATSERRLNILVITDDSYIDIENKEADENF